MSRKPSTAGYADEAPELLQRYEAMSSAQTHAPWQDLFVPAPARVLDIGAGTGRDAAWLVSLGYTVTAVEPTDALREGAMDLHPEPAITWYGSALPDLADLPDGMAPFDMVWLIAVWMHLTADERAAGMARIVGLMRRGARLFMALRHGPVPEGRRMFEVSGAETIELAAAHGLTCLREEETPSLQAENRRLGITWTRLVFEKV